MAERPSYTGAQLALRDQKVKETHEKDLDVLRKKNERLRRNFDNSEKMRFEERQRANTLATLLGYGDAQQAIFDLEELAVEGTSLRDFKTRAQDAEEELKKEKEESEKLRERVKEAEREVKQLKAEKRQLEEKYDALVSVKERSTEYLKVYHKKWANVNKWLFGEDTPSNQVIKKRSESLQRKRQAMRDHEPNSHMLHAPDSIDPPEVPPNYGDKENSPMPPLKRRRVSENPSASHTPATNTPANNTPAGSPLVRNALLSAITNVEPPSCSPTVFLDDNSALKAKQRVPLNSHEALPFKPVEDVNIKDEPQEPSLTPCPAGGRSDDISPPESPNASQAIPGSSQRTEDDSQAIILPSTTAPFGRPGALIRAPAPAPPAPGSAYWNRNPRHPLHPSLPSRPSFATTQAAVKLEPGSSSRRPLAMLETPVSGKMMLGTPSSTPRTTLFKEPPSATLVSSMKGKERARVQEDETPMASRTQGHKKADDYSAFKGRGRYSKPDEPTINSMFAIATEKNNGRDYQYDEVVRRKDDRRRLDGGDCECCREYYEGVGPLPERLQPPLWRSPSKSQSQRDFHSPTRRPCLNQRSSSRSRSPTRHRDTNLTRSVDRPAHGHSHSHGGSGSGSTGHRAGADSSSSRRRHSEIAEHKKAISRHRQNWERAKTPPGYWDIGFPDTQEVGNINEKAKEMHRRKRDEVEREAEREDGRYRRR